MSNTIRNVISASTDSQLEAAGAAAGPAAARNATGAARPDPVAPASGDHTILSPLGDLLNTTVQTAATLSSFRSDRVAALRSAIASGTYHPDLGQVAQRVALATQHLGTRTSLDDLTRAIDAITNELAESPPRSADDLTRLRSSLDFTSAVIARLRHAVRSQIGAIAGETFDAG